MRYQRGKSKDWVEVNGAADLELAELDQLFGDNLALVQERVTALVTDCCFTNRKGEPVDPLGNFRRLTYKQWQWLRRQIVESSLQEVLDPEE